jgi:hypothetical protein
MAAWLAALGLAGLTLGWGTFWFALAAAVTVHAFALVLACQGALRERSWQVRACFGLAVYLALQGLVYGPAFWLGRQYVRLLPIEGIVSSELLANGDVLVVSGPRMRAEGWQAGDLVVYRLRRVVGAGLVLGAGLGVDRVLGCSGEHLAFVRGILTLDGRRPPAGAGPLVQRTGIPDFELVPDAGECLVFPSLLALHGNGAMARELLAAASRVQAADIQGRVLWRVRPLSRFGPLAGSGP